MLTGQAGELASGSACWERCKAARHSSHRAASSVTSGQKCQGKLKGGAVRDYCSVIVGPKQKQHLFHLYPALHPSRFHHFTQWQGLAITNTAARESQPQPAVLASPSPQQGRAARGTPFQGRHHQPTVLTGALPVALPVTPGFCVPPSSFCPPWLPLCMLTVTGALTCQV